VPAGSEFDFHVVCQPQRLPESLRDRWRSALEAIFAHAFDWLGFGAKTAAGYGAMTWKNPPKRHPQPASPRRAQ
jgi:CRISPR-associated protein Cmr6